jgi:hypothetical protein
MYFSDIYRHKPEITSETCAFSYLICLIVLLRKIPPVKPQGLTLAVLRLCFMPGSPQ